MNEIYTCVLQTDGVTTICTANYKTVGYSDFVFMFCVLLFFVMLPVLGLLFKPISALFK
jgi:hypothetical protein